MQIWQKLLDLVFPRFNQDYTSWQSYLTQAEIRDLNGPLEIDLQNKNNHLNKIYSATNFKNSKVANLIKRAKIMGQTAICQDLVRLIQAKIFTDNFRQNYNLSRAAITFVPPDPKRYKKRGYHLPQIMAQKLAKENNLIFLESLEKTKHSPSQTDLKREQRLLNNQGHFDAKKVGQSDFYPTLFLIDDVTTTYQTLKECAKTLKPVFPKSEIVGIVVCS